MKWIKFLLLFLLVSCSCNKKIAALEQINQECSNQLDSVLIELYAAQDSIATLSAALQFEIDRHNDCITNLNSCDSTNRVLTQELFVANYKLGRIKEYCKIVKKDNTQLKFLLGWINRVLEN